MFDSLKCAKMLVAHGLDQRQAEGVTKALKVEMNTHLVTKDLFESEFARLRSEIKLMFEMQNQRIDLKFAAQDQRIDSRFASQDHRIDSKFENFEKSITIRMGSMLAAAVILLSALQSAFFFMLK